MVFLVFGHEASDLFVSNEDIEHLVLELRHEGVMIFAAFVPDQTTEQPVRPELQSTGKTAVPTIPDCPKSNHAAGSCI